MRPNLSQGARLLLSAAGTAWEEALITQISGIGGFSASTVDTTNLSNDEMDYIKGLSDSKEISATLQWDTDTDFDKIITDHRAAYGADANAIVYYKILVPFATTPCTFSGTCIITDFSGVEASVNGVATASMTFKPKGAPTVTAGATT